MAFDIIAATYLAPLLHDNSEYTFCGYQRSNKDDCNLWTASHRRRVEYFLAQTALRTAQACTVAQKTVNRTSDTIHRVTTWASLSCFRITQSKFSSIRWSQKTQFSNNIYVLTWVIWWFVMHVIDDSYHGRCGIVGCGRSYVSHLLQLVCLVSSTNKHSYREYRPMVDKTGQQKQKRYCKLT